jgi:hypothetical protein
MGKRNRYRDHIDPEYQRWGRKYPRFPGVGECANLIRAGKARGAWADIIASELSENAAHCLPELIEAFHSDSSGDVCLYVMMALESARLPEAVPFLANVLHEGDPRFTPYAARALRNINTPEARTMLWEASQSGLGTTPE